MKYKVNTPSLETRVILVAIFFAVLVSLQALVAFADEQKQIQVFEVRKLLQLTSKDPVIHDYYVNAGQEQGLKEGALVNVYRKTPLADPYKEQTQAHVDLPVGTLKVIYSDRTMAIGRIAALRSPKDSPVLDGSTFMVGDRIDLSSLSFEKKAEASSGGSDTVKAKAPAVEEPAGESEKAVETKPAPPSKDEKEAKKLDAQSRKSASVEPPKAEKAENKAKSQQELDKPAHSQAKSVEVLTK